MEIHKKMVSVIIPTYNRGYIIRKSIDSVLSQTYSDFELIIIDDGSTDNTKDIIEAYKDSRIKYVYQENSGACAARNNGVLLAKGEYIAFHDSDDTWLPDKLEKQIQAINEIGADIVSCQMITHDQNGKKKLIPELDKSQFINLDIMSDGISTQTLLMKNNVAKHIQFDSEMPRLQDIEWLLRALKIYRLYVIKQGLVNYEVLPDSISSSSEKLYKAIKLIKNKHPYIKKESPVLAGIMADAMKAEGMSKFMYNNKMYRDYLMLYYSLSNERYSRIKCYILKLGLFKIYYKLSVIRRKM